MPVRQYAAPGLVIAAAMLFTLGCGETPTSPQGPLLKKGPPPPTVAITNLNLATTVFTIGGPGVPYTVDIENNGPKLTGIALQAEVHQGATYKGAGGLMVNCRSELGLLPRGNCTLSFETGAYNTSGGPGDLVPGAATLLLYVFGPNGELARTTVAVTLQ